ncbi:ATP-binding protein [Thiothrix lacustris]|uniref:ATP-binding protein n=1 Tax=Thiothrix lacustris TaxID=525917 RepID=UPI00048B5AE9|nr:AAA family ATPase [Thiothrix lacustris]
MFNRQAVSDIIHWYQQPQRKPLVIRGARQVGKTTAVRMAGAQLGIPVIEINLERHAELEALFRRYQLDELLFNFALISGEQVTPDKPLILFLDEAQATPAAYACLRYFWEDMPNLAVILTGSLLDQVLNDYKLPSPVGRIDPYFMGALRFDEFLQAIGADKELRALDMLTASNMHLIPDSLHEKLLGLVRRYTLTGGMPHCVQLGLDTGFSHADILKYQTALLQTYRDDFAKYRGSQTALTLNTFFNGILGQVGQQFSHKQANELAASSSGDNRQLNTAIEHFIAARLFYRVLHSHADAVPLGAETKTRISKFLFIDIGLLLAAQGIPVQSILHAPLELAGRGSLAEQFVGQQLLYAKPAYINPELYYWQPPKAEAQAEVDFLYTQGNEIIAVEVKAGSGGTIKSLQSFVIKKQANRAVRISSAKPSLDRLEAKSNGQSRPFQLFNIPFYLVNRLESLLAS